MFKGILKQLKRDVHKLCTHMYICLLRGKLYGRDSQNKIMNFSQGNPM